eukprot:CAMPEP_0176456934 /NCGR_PEP_ID=MMETSP0127-20121128/31605_1 /TAXON_ID=938130 /ORGANISM="Platyophrya macrostoma, Strain WH" /LENGTH=343 /DNA_ID=CAMNT_0017847031 /DNA_START=11 /DNA_END=1042 /DNA_ORIENTATION=-
MKFRNFTLLVGLIAFTGGVIGLAVTLLLSWFIWVPALIVMSPGLAVIFLLIKYTPLGKWLFNIYASVYDWAFYKSEGARNFLWQEFYDLICWLYPQVRWRLMNYGYAPLTEDGALIKDVPKEYEEEKFPVQLYHYVASALGKSKNLNNQVVLEVGSGRGGGLSYISTQMGPKLSVGVDFSANQIEFCKGAYAKYDRLSFYQGNAEQLSAVEGLKDLKFDTIINVESSHCYGNFRRFIREVSSMLKPDGHFCFTDFRQHNEIDQLEEELTSSGLVIEKKENITANVLHALKLDEARRNQLIEGFVHSWLRPIFRKFSGLQGSRINDAMKAGETLYMAYVLRLKA